MITIEDLSPQRREALLERVLNPSGETKWRRDEFRLRRLALLEQHEELVKERIGDVYNMVEVINELRRYALSIFNPMRRIVRRVAVAYKTPPNRRLSKGGKTVNKTFTQLLRKIRFDARAKAWNEMQVAMNTIVVLVVPKQRSDGTPVPDFEVITGADGEVELDPQAPFADVPAILAYPIAPTQEGTGVFDPDRPAVATVDAKWWIFWNANKEPVKIVEHNVGRFPGEVLRNTEPQIHTTDGWWDPWNGRAVTQTNAEVGMTASVMGWVRKTQNSFLVSVLRGSDKSNTMEGEGEADEQAMGHPEALLELTGENVQLMVHDLNVSIKNFREHIDFLTAEAAEVLTGASSVLVDPEPGQVVADLSHATNHAALRERQEDQISGLRSFEEGLLTVVADIATQIRCPWAVPRDLVEESLEIEFAALPFLDTPDNRLKHAIEATRYGVTDQVEYLREVHDLDELAAEERLLHIAERRARLHAVQAERNSPADPNTPASEGDEALPGERPEARTGRAGGRARPPAQPAA